MNSVVIDPADVARHGELTGAILAEEGRSGGRRIFRKGEIVTADRIGDLARLDAPVHAVLPERDEMHEDAAAMRLATAIAGPGTVLRGPVLSRVNLRADRKGLLRVDEETVAALNRIQDVAVFTLIDRLAVLPGRILAGVKITPIATHTDNIEAAEKLAGHSPVIQVKPFLPLKVGVFSTEGMNQQERSRFEVSVRAKVSWYGGTIIEIIELPRDAERVSATIASFIDGGAGLILAGGGNTIDPLDPTLLALPEIGAEIVTFGAPVHPGSMLWLAYCGDIPIFNLASCSMFAKSTSADLILPWIMAGERVGDADIAALGYGGLLDRDMQFRFPPYDAGSEPEED